SRYLFFHSHSIEITVVPDPRGDDDVLGVRLGYRDPEQLIPPQSVDLVLLFLHHAMRSVLGGDYGLRSVELPNPLNIDAERYESLFGAPVTPSTSTAALRVPSDLLGRTISGVDQTVQQLAMQYLDQHIPADRRSFTERTREVLHQSLDTGTSSLAAVAGMLAVSPRTLPRELAGENTTFGGIGPGVRRALAAPVRTTTAIPLYQVASALALGDATTFSQYARRWWGMTARELRPGRKVGESRA